MSFLDRIRNGEKEEVELTPEEHRKGNSRVTSDNTADEVELHEESDNTGDNEASFLPGTTNSSSESTQRRTNSPEQGDDTKLETIMEQNERIIELLEQIAGMNDPSREKSTDTSSNTNNDELW